MDHQLGWHPPPKANEPGNERIESPLVTQRDRIAFVSAAEHGSEIYVLWTDTRQLTKITELDGSSGLSWSPDGTQIAFSMKVAGKEGELVKAPEKPKGAQWADVPRVTTLSSMSGMVPAIFHRDSLTCSSFPQTEEPQGKSVLEIFTTAILRNGPLMVLAYTSRPTAIRTGSSSSAIPRFTDSIWQAVKSLPYRIGTVPITAPVFPRRNHHRLPRIRRQSAGLSSAQTKLNGYRWVQ